MITILLLYLYFDIVSPVSASDLRSASAYLRFGMSCRARRTETAGPCTADFIRTSSIHHSSSTVNRQSSIVHHPMFTRTSRLVTWYLLFPPLPLHDPPKFPCSSSAHRVLRGSYHSLCGGSKSDSRRPVRNIRMRHTTYMYDTHALPAPPFCEDPTT